MHRNRFNKLILKKNSFKLYFLLEDVLNKVFVICGAVINWVGSYFS